MHSVRLGIAAALIGLSAWAGEPEPPPHLTPVPKVWRRTGGDIALSASLSIVLGSKATEPERYAAETLQQHIQRRFARAIPIHVEDKVPEGAQQVVLLGQAETNAWLARLLREKGIEHEPRSESRDDFLIEIVADGARQVVVLGGASARAVTYAQDAFFQLLERKDGGVVFPAVSLRDWPSIAWRGRVAAQYAWHVRPGMMDAYARARFNLVDLRQICGKGRAKHSGIHPGAPLDVERMRHMIAEAHRRGILVFGVVWCGVPTGQHGQAIALFERLLDEGVDGIWVSFDDGGKGKAPAAIIERALEMAKQRGLPLDRVATTPMMGSYEWVDTATNRELAKAGDFGQVRWFFTSVPGPGNTQAAQKIGLTRKPSWWHNWPHRPGGFLYAGSSLPSMRADGGHPYIPPFTVREGWGNPPVQRLTTMPAHVDAVMYNGLGFTDYVPPIFGFWAWEPARHDWARTRDAVYRHVFGSAHAADARAFDDGLMGLMALFNMPIGRATPGDNWPPTLKAEGMRDMAAEQAEALEEIADRLAKGAPTASMIEPERLESEVLEPMRATLATARALAKADFLEFGKMRLAFQLERLVKEDKRADAQRLLAETQARIPALRKQFQEDLKGLRGVEAYLDAWSKHLSSVGYFVRAAERERHVQKQGFVFFQNVKLGEALEGLSKPPAGEVVAEARPESWLEGPLLKIGDVRMGMLGKEAKTAVGVGYMRDTRYGPHYYGEVHASLSVPAVEGPVALDIYAGAATIGRAPGARLAQLWLGDRLLWQQDVLTLAADSQWYSIDITDDVRGGATLQFRFRATNERPTYKYLTVAFLGPVRVRRGTVAATAPEAKPPLPAPPIPKPPAPKPPAASHVPPAPSPTPPQPKPAPQASAAKPVRPAAAIPARPKAAASVVIRRVPVAGKEPPNVPLYVFLGLSLALNAHLAWRLFRRRAGTHS
jgi:hypothetical protein